MAWRSSGTNNAEMVDKLTSEYDVLTFVVFEAFVICVVCV